MGLDLRDKSDTGGWREMYTKDAFLKHFLNLKILSRTVDKTYVYSLRRGGEEHPYSQYGT